MNHKSNAQITLRGLPKPFLKSMVAEAKGRRISLNTLLTDKLLPSPAKPSQGVCAELIKFAGTWSKERAKDFATQTADLRKIDKKMWPS